MIVECEIDHLLHVCRNMAPIWLEECHAVIEQWDAIEHAIYLYNLPGPRYACVDETTGLPVMAGGLNLQRRGLAETWMAGTAGWEKHAVEIARASRAVVKALLDGVVGISRIHMVTTKTGGAVKKRWIECLGLSLEAEMKFYGLNGETMCIYAVVAKEGA